MTIGDYVSKKEIEKVIEKVNNNSYCKKLGFPARNRHYAQAIASLPIPQSKDKEELEHCRDVNTKLKKEIIELRTTLKRAHQVFGAESDKLKQSKLVPLEKDTKEAVEVVKKLIKILWLNLSEKDVKALNTLILIAEAQKPPHRNKFQEVTD